MAEYVKPFFKSFCQIESPEKTLAKFPSFTVQVVRSKEIGPGKIRVYTSDGEFVLACIYTFDAPNTEVKIPDLEIIKVTDYSIFFVKQKPCVVLRAFDVLSEPVAKIGEPAAIALTAINTPSESNTSTTAATETTTTTPAAATSTPARNPARPAAQMNARIFPISDLGPYRNDWTIRAKVVFKSDFVTFKGKNSTPGKLFNVTLADHSGEIRATAFTDVADQFYSILEEGKAYYISNATLKVRNSTYNKVIHDYEMSFRRDTTIAPCGEDVALPEVKYNFTKINDLGGVSNGATADVIAILKEVQPLETITSKTTGSSYDKRELILVDQTNYQVKCTLWAKKATTFDAEPGSVILIKDAKVSDFGGCSLSTNQSTAISINPTLDESFALKGWYDAIGPDIELNTLSLSNSNMNSADGTGAKSNAPRLSFFEIQTNGLGTKADADYFTIRAFVDNISKRTMVYPACTNSEKCRKKMMKESDDMYVCHTCNIRSPTPFYRYALNVQLADHTGSEFMSAFDVSAELILGRPAAEIGTYKENDDESAIFKICDEAKYKEYIFRCSARQDTYNEITRINYSILSVKPIDYHLESSILLDEIEKLSGKIEDL